MTTTSSGPSSLAQLIDRGYALLRDGRLAEAAALANTAIKANSGNAHLLVLASEVALAQGQATDALALIQQAVLASGGHPALKLKTAGLLLRLRRRQEAALLLAQVAEQAAGNGRLLWQTGSLYSNCQRFSDAIAQFENAHRLLGDDPGLLYDMAVAKFFTGDFDGAESALIRMPEGAPQLGHSLYLRATLRRQTTAANHIDEIERRLKAGFRDPANEASAWYALAKELEDLGEDERSFAALQKGAAKKRSTFQYDVDDECAALQAVREAYSADVFTAPPAGHEDGGPIFIVGMPRTGTTLAERLLVQSGKVRSAGELLDFGNLLANATQARMASDPSLVSSARASLQIDFEALGKEYVRGARESADGSALFIDKMPINYLYCGMIHKALPRAKIIHLVRDPLDACYAVFKTQFFNAYNFSYSLEELADYYIAYHQMMCHWHAVLPGVILDVRYEDLVSDTETQARRILDWCGLEWNPRVLETSSEVAFASASAAQVRQPIYRRSVNSASKHRKALAAVVRKLETAGII